MSLHVFIGSAVWRLAGPHTVVDRQSTQMLSWLRGIPVLAAHASSWATGAMGRPQTVQFWIRASRCHGDKLRIPLTCSISIAPVGQTKAQAPQWAN
ncbi:MAG: hypothetical protein QNL88_13975 [Acidobacteriota bacterium]|nr:hypothetical protein [Acidobacteriota bacterium]